MVESLAVSGGSFLQHAVSCVKLEEGPKGEEERTPPYRLSCDEQLSLLPGTTSRARQVQVVVELSLIAPCHCRVGLTKTRNVKMSC
ncbi:hypothetical protein CRG98_045270 [Punica granatum]|uniref:Uncharacterized protein n=1 Tax=Punica granatum TaxID=22663 RepID=A0A2I0HRL7_PUNGR|nr:hypothetical protein CRG98_045270 [Punica granatum]